MTSLITVRRCLIFLAVGVGIYLLHWAEEFLMPLVLSLLLADVLSPAVRYLRRWRIGNAAAVTIVTLVVASVVIGGILLLSAQVIDLTTQLPDYRDNIIGKIQTLRSSTGGSFARLTGLFGEVGEAISPGPATQPYSGAPTTSPTTKPVPVQIVGPQTQTAVVATGLVAPVLVPLGNAGIVFALLFFFLLEHDLMTHRIRWLMRRGNVGIASQTVDDASTRVGNYLRMQLLVNVCYGTLVGVALTFLGLPSAILLAAIAAALRYIPYVGPLIGIALPTALAIAVFPDWYWPLIVLTALLVIELITNMVLEPLLYGSSTGVSSTGVIIASFFWGWVWGAMGLILAMPITVWIVIVGRYLPSLRWLSVLLSADEIGTIEKEDDTRDRELDDHMEGWAE